MFRQLPLMATLLVAFVATTISPADVFGQSWAHGLFKETKHDFGVVARAAKTKHVFEFTNTTGSTLHISNARTSCNCTIPRVLTHTVEPGQVGMVEAEFNTRAFKGQRGANVTVVFTSPSYTEVQLRVDGYIRGDIVINPGEVVFGNNVVAGDESERKVTIHYAGNSNWAVSEVQTNNPNIIAEVKETKRQGMYIDYELSVKLDPKFPPGPINQELVLVTNDGARKKVPLMMTGQVRAAIEVPSVLDVGRIKSGETVSKVLIVKAQRTFTVLEVASNDPRIEVTQSDDAKKMHVIKLTINGSKEGEFANQVTLKTDDPTMPEATIKIMGDVVSDAK